MRLAREAQSSKLKKSSKFQIRPPQHATGAGNMIGAWSLGFLLSFELRILNFSSASPVQATEIGEER
jgi:hypothetical protein